ncbi:hypothetical protein KO561_09180 [Radiobacillus kanasensis]|uniref:ABC transporter permease subunit n=1 Tax=Radiobacillus kanasensis TaxID=2844358 RepID=UPI001E41C72D|nr:ABC transporter permease subunit [Radiobacillus kanasensis]UFU01087.1 hypothetical protein KO561_09180 [Radiobacillus kanasensis]
MRFLSIFIHYILSIFGLVVVSCLPVFFKNSFPESLTVFAENVSTVISSFFQPSEWYYHQRINYMEIVERPIFSFLMEHYLYSMTILLSALFIALAVGFLLAIASFQAPARWKRFIQNLLNSLEALPDVLFLFLLQMLVVWVYKWSGLLLFPFVELGDERIYLSPILSLAILPSVLFFKVIFLLLEEEWGKDYVVLARSKGLSNFKIITLHCIRNIKQRLLIQSKPIIWATLSSLLVIEYLHGIYGIVNFVFYDSRPFTMSIALLMIFTPFFLIYRTLEWVVALDGDKLDDHYAKMYRRIAVTSGTSPLQINGKKHLVSIKNMCKDLSKKPKFWFGITFMLSVTAWSFIHSATHHPDVELFGIFHDETGQLQAPPHPPGALLLGSDPYGYPILDMLIKGAKYTVLVSVFIAFCRVGIAYLLTIPYMFWFGKRVKQAINRLADGMQFLPLTLIAYILLFPVVIFSDGQKELAESLMIPNMILEIVILILFVIPVLLNTLGREATQLLKSESIQAAVLLGASKSRIFFTHITSHLLPRMVYLMGQQMIQVLQVLVHLGVLGIFLGGTILGDRAAQSLTNEWTSMFELLRVGIVTKQYWFVVPVLMLYALLIYSIQAVTRSALDVQQAKVGLVAKYSSHKKFQGWNTEKDTVSMERSPDAFTFMNR